MAAPRHSLSVYRLQTRLFEESFQCFFAFHYWNQPLLLSPRFSPDDFSGWRPCDYPCERFSVEAPPVVVVVACLESCSSGANADSGTCWADWVFE